MKILAPLTCMYTCLQVISTAGMSQMYVSAGDLQYDKIYKYLNNLECSCVEVLQTEYDTVIFSLIIKYLQQELIIPLKLKSPQTNMQAKKENLHLTSCAYLTIVQNNNSIVEAMDDAVANFHLNSRAYFIFIVINIQKPQLNEIIKAFENLWQKYYILYAVTLTVDKTEDAYDNYDMWTYNPFKKQLYYDQFVSVNLKYEKFHGQPIPVVMFGHYPTAYTYMDDYVLHNVPKIRRISYNQLQKGLYMGVDGQFAYNMAKFLNFTPILKSTEDMSYGFYLENGTYTGVLGQIVSRNACIAFNSRFIKQYDIREIEFTSTIMNDKLCIIVPKSKLIPRWRRMLLSFNAQLWVILFCTYVVITSFWYTLRRFNNFKSSEWYVVCGSFKIFLLNGLFRPPRILSERCLFGSLLIFCLVVTNAFQSLLVTNITYPNYEADINTLKDLDESNLTIWSRSPENRDVFKDMDMPLMDRLFNKFSIFNGSAQELVHHVCNLTDAAVIIRETSSSYTETTYVAEDGSQLIHTVQECPATYQLAFTVPSGSPYLPTFNKFILRMNEAGLTFKWHKDGINIHSILRKRKLAEKDAPRVFSIHDLQLSFFIYVGGMVLSILVYIIEKVYKSYTYCLNHE